MGLIAGLVGFGLNAASAPAATVDSFTSGDLLVAISEEPSVSQASAGGVSDLGTSTGGATSSSAASTPSARAAPVNGPAALSGTAAPTSPDGALNPSDLEDFPTVPFTTTTSLTRVEDEDEEDDAADPDEENPWLAWISVPILGGTMVVPTTGNVTVTYLGGDAGYPSSLYLDAPLDDDLFVFSSDAPIGGTVDIGSFVAGDELIFRLDVAVPESPFQLFTGDGSLNPDGLPHALAITEFDKDLGLFLTEVGFEDLLGGGDGAYNGFVFQLTNVADPPTNPAPEPATLALLGLGLAGIPFVRRRRTPA